MDAEQYMVTGDLDYRVTSIDSIGEQLFGLTVEEARAMAMHEVICAKEFAPAALAIFTEVHRGRFQWEGEMLARQHGRPGRLFQTQVRISPVEDSSGAMVGLVAVGHDLTEEQVEDDDEVRWTRYEVQEKNHSPSTAFTYIQAKHRIEKFLKKPASEIDTDDVRRFLRDSNYHPATKSSTLVGFKAYRRWGVVEGKWEPNGVEYVQAPKQHRLPKPALTPDEARKIMDACRRPTEFRVIYFGLLAGCRVSDSAIIGPQQWMSDRLRFVGVKERRWREIPVHPLLTEKRETILSKSTSRGTLKHVVRSLSHYTGIYFTTHTLRRTFMVQQRNLGVPREVIRELTGHSHPDVLTNSYAGVTWPEMVRAIAVHTYEESAVMYTPPMTLPNPTDGMSVREFNEYMRNKDLRNELPPDNATGDDSA